jgi:hypothetical protein
VSETTLNTSAENGALGVVRAGELLLGVARVDALDLGHLVGLGR